jgi:putative salt-induced outer membrane protein YdiY
MRTILSIVRRLWARSALAATLIVGSQLVLAEEKPAAVTNAPPVKSAWETTAAAGFTLTKGNSDTMLLTLSLDSKAKWKNDEAGFGIAAGYGEDHSVKNNEFVNAYAQYNHLFTQRLYAGLRTDFSYDGIANLDYRITVSPLVGYYLVKNTNTTFAVETGPSVVFEQYQAQSENTYLGVRFAERFEHKLTATTKIWEHVEYVPKVTAWTEKYVITAEAGIDTAINKKWGLRVMLQDIYDSQPATGREPNDLRLIAGTTFKF